MLKEEAILGRLDESKLKDLKVLSGFIGIYCREKHPPDNRAAFSFEDERLKAILKKELALCPECHKLLEHGIMKRLLCPYNPKPMCKRCRTHCYAPGYREKMREVMRFSGGYLIKHGRLDLLFHYLF